MFFIIFFFNLFFISSSKETIGCDDIILMSETYKNLSECQTYEVEENMQCCVGVISIMGKNNYFCQSFNKSATEEDITTEMDKKVKSYEDKFLGAVIKAKASCTKNVTPFIGTKCNIEDSQNSLEFNNCSTFKKEQEDNFCCLFSGNVLMNNDKYGVDFCYEVNKSETSDMNKVARDIDSHNRMIDINYINCSPEIPIKPDTKGANFIKNNNKLYFLITILLIMF